MEFSLEQSLHLTTQLASPRPPYIQTAIQLWGIMELAKQPGWGR
jgi:hypothetical protein